MHSTYWWPHSSIEVLPWLWRRGCQGIRLVETLAQHPHWSWQWNPPPRHPQLLSTSYRSQNHKIPCFTSAYHRWGVLSFSFWGSTTPSYWSRFLLVHCYARIQFQSFGILLTFVTILPRLVGPCMLSPRRIALPKLSLIPKSPMHRHTLEFGTITYLQHLRSRSSFLPRQHWTLCQRIKWVERFSLDQIFRL